MAGCNSSSKSVQYWHICVNWCCTMPATSPADSPCHLSPFAKHRFHYIQDGYNRPGPRCVDFTKTSVSCLNISYFVSCLLLLRNLSRDNRKSYNMSQAGVCVCVYVLCNVIFHEIIPLWEWQSSLWGGRIVCLSSWAIGNPTLSVCNLLHLAGPSRNIRLVASHVASCTSCPRCQFLTYIVEIGETVPGARLHATAAYWAYCT